MKILVTGGLGLIGSKLIYMLNARGHEVIATDIGRNYISERDKSLFDHQYSNYRRTLIGSTNVLNLDSRNKLELLDAFSEFQPELVFHLAAIPIANISNSMSEETTSNIVNSTLNIAECARRMKTIPKIVYSSSSMVYGNFETPIIDETHNTNPISMYGATKLAGEILLRGYAVKYGIPYSIIRPSAVYGPGDSNMRVVQLFLEKAMAGNKIVVKGEHSVLDFTYVDDIANGFLEVGLNPKANGEIFNVTSENPKSLGELAENIRHQFPDVKIIYEPHEIDVPIRGGLCNKKIKNLLGFSKRTTFEVGFHKYFQEQQILMEKT